MRSIIMFSKRKEAATQLGNVSPNKRYQSLALSNSGWAPTVSNGPNKFCVQSSLNKITNEHLTGL